MKYDRCSELVKTLNRINYSIINKRLKLDSPYDFEYKPETRTILVVEKPSSKGYEIPPTKLELSYLEVINDLEKRMEKVLVTSRETGISIL